MPDVETPIEIFCSYAHEDEPLLQELERHLSLLSWQGMATLWHSRCIAPGTNWSQSIDAHLDAASVILLLISSDFLASQYCYGIEMQRALERHKANEAHVIPIILRSCDWQRAPFASMQVLPADPRPITMWHDRDSAWTEVTKGIRRVLETPSSGAPDFLRSPGRAIWNVPFACNPFFTGREELLEQLHTQLQRTRAIALSQPQAISGLGGIGKTQLAIEYAYRYRKDYQAVLWARADTTEALNASYTEIAELFQLPQKNAKEQEVVVQAVKDWLSTKPGWLLVLDNADEPHILLFFLPTQGAGQVLVTTRTADLTDLGLGFGHALVVQTFTDDQGALFLLHRSNQLPPDATLDRAEQGERQRAREIAHELGGLPLALDQAGAYLCKTGCSLAVYQQIYQHHRTQLLKERWSADYPEPVATTWSLSFEKVKQASSLAAEVLHFCAFLAPDAIPEELLIQAMIPEQQGASWEFNEALAALRAYSLIQRQTQDRLLRVHRLVQVVVRDRIEEQEQVFRITRLTSAVETLFPWGDVENWKQCERYLSQALICAEWMKQKNLLLSDGAMLCINAGWYLHCRAQYKEAESLYQQALHIWEKSLGPEHPQVAYPLNNLADLYNNQGKYGKAELLYQQALHIWEKSLGPEHPQVAYPLYGLASLYFEQGKYEEVEPLCQRALHICEKSLGPEHPDVASPLYGLASLYFEQGKYAEAEPLYQRALGIYEKSLGPEHPQVAYPLNGLAMLYSEQGKYGEAEPLYQRAVAIREKSLGSAHPRTQEAVNNYALFLQATGYEKDAKKQEDDCNRKTPWPMQGLQRSFEMWGATIDPSSRPRSTMRGLEILS